MKHISWIVTLPLTLVLVVFSLANREPVSVDFWPFGWQQTLPLSWLVLGSLFAGFLIGGVIMWLSGARARHRARDLRFDKTHLEREVIRLKREVERVKGQAAQDTQTPQTPATSRAPAIAARNGQAGASPLPAVPSGR